MRGFFTAIRMWSTTTRSGLDVAVGGGVETAGASGVTVVAAAGGEEEQAGEGVAGCACAAF